MTLYSFKHKDKSPYCAIWQISLHTDFCWNFLSFVELLHDFKMLTGGHIGCPKISFSILIKLYDEIQSLRFTRQSRLSHIPRCVSNFASKLPLYMLPSIWNKWASHLSENTTRNQLKKHVKSTLTEHYSSNVYCSNTFCTDCRK